MNSSYQMEREKKKRPPTLSLLFMPLHAAFSTLVNCLHAIFPPKLGRKIYDREDDGIPKFCYLLFLHQAVPIQH
uniref:Putative ovule protein n=1 Tax=Solanum chacoense TaxID=4108 RepID=A0A0V0HKD5_SOLCH